jgi:hypothetical protein
MVAADFLKYAARSTDRELTSSADGRGGACFGIGLGAEHGHERDDPSASSGSKLPRGSCLTVVAGVDGPTASRSRIGAVCNHDRSRPWPNINAYPLTRGGSVMHVMGNDRIDRAKLTLDARVLPGGTLVYPAVEEEGGQSIG